MKCDFSGWATKNDLECSDGRTIRRGAFADDDGKRVPLVWNHNHDGGGFNVLGHAILHNAKDGVIADCYLNDTDQGKNARKLLEHQDISALSIYANKLKQRGGDVLHGSIKEVSLVLSGANPGACITSLNFAHGDDVDDEEAIVYTGENIVIAHSIDEEPEEEKSMPDVETLVHAEDEEKKEPPKKEEDKGEDGETIQDVVDSMNEKQKKVLYALVGMAAEGEGKPKASDNDEDEGGKEMKHNVFDAETPVKGSVICHADQEEILKLAKNSSVGSWKNAWNMYKEDNALQHADDPAQASGFNSYNGDVDLLFPDYKDLKTGAPDLITDDQGWITRVINKCHKLPFSRVRTGQVDIRAVDKLANDPQLRARGYMKGRKKVLTGNFKLVRRTTDPQTIYVKNALNKDDITDIVDFDYVAYMYNIDRMMLNEELATAILFGDGRDDGDPDKIYPEHIRPVWTDDDLYTLHVKYDMEEAKKTFHSSAVQEFGENYYAAEYMVNLCLYSRENFKGTGLPDMYITPHMLNVMLLARDLNGRRIYSSKDELRAALNVNEIITVEQMANKTRTVDGVEKKLVCLMVNLADYSLGSTKGGEISHFTQFDIDFNQEKSLIETRVSGALTKVYSAIAIEEDVLLQNP